MNRSTVTLIFCNVLLGLWLFSNQSSSPAISGSGYSLAIQQAQNNKDLAHETFYKINLAHKEPTLNHVKEAFESALLSGNFNGASYLLNFLQSDDFLWHQFQQQISTDADGITTYILIYSIITNIHKERWQTASAHIELLQQSPRSSNNFERRMKLWLYVAKGDISDALILIRRDTDDGTRILMEALMRDIFSNDIVTTRRLYANAMQRRKDDFVTSLLYANYLMRHELWNEASRIFRHIGKNRQLYFVARQGLSWTEEEYKPPRMVSQGSFGSFGLALSLYNNAFESDNADTEPKAIQSLSWLRLSQYSHETFAPASFLSYLLLDTLSYKPQALQSVKQMQLSPLWRIFALYVQASMFQQSHSVQKAEKFLRQALLDFPDDRFLNGTLGEVLLQTKEYSESLIAYDQAIAELDSYERLGDFSDEDEKEILAEYYYGRAVALQKTNRLEESEEALTISLDYKDDDPYTLNYLAYSWIEQNKQLDEAIALLRKAKELSPHNGSIVDSYGWGLYKLGQLDEAVTILEEAASYLPNDPVINDHLGDALWLNNRRIEAIYHWRRALNAVPIDGSDDELGKNIKKKLDDPLQRPENYNQESSFFAP